MLFSTVPQLVSKLGSRHGVGEILAKLIAARQLPNSKVVGAGAASSVGIVTDPGLLKLGLIDDVVVSAE
jgi:hypothetical protein